MGVASRKGGKIYENKSADKEFNNNTALGNSGLKKPIYPMN
jgi:hypothetical protein